GNIKPHQQNSESDSFGLKGKFITGSHQGDSGSAARFFYCAKASKRDRNEGLDGFEVRPPAYESHRANYQTTKGIETPFAGTGRSGKDFKNHHPTVKPTDLMRYLCRLVTPPNGIVLDPFMGSGSTGKAAMYEGFEFVGIELTDEYLPIAKARIEFAIEEMKARLL
ncbi:MAG: site-specific DNA-methyltransferase, partial [Gammaproteobacteria bacterium]|nr:site-specific DNA-methyltransferase [Gammaproteobacteria bacterium]